MIGRELSIIQHLAELRRRVFISVLAILAGTVVAFAFWEDILKVLVRPAGDVQLIAIEVTEVLATAVKISFITGFALAFPVILFQVVMFLAPGMTNREKRYLFAFLPGGILAFAAGVAFGYFGLVPPTLKFLIGLGGEIVRTEPRVSNVVNVTIRLLLGMGLAFRTPLGMYLLAQLGLVNVRMLGRFRRYWLVVAFVLGAIITPTVDPIYQVAVAAPLVVLYELGILLARLAERSRRASQAATPSS